MGRGRHHRRATPRNTRDRYAAAAVSALSGCARTSPSPNVQVATEGIAALLRGAACDFAEVALDMTGIPAFNQRVYAYARAIPRGETRIYAEVAAHLRASGAVYSVAQAIGRNPFMIIVPCHRVLEAGNYADKISPHGGAISKRRLLSIEGAHPTSRKTLFDVLLPVAPPRAHT